MKIKTQDLIDTALDFAVKKALGDIGIIVVRDGKWLDHDEHRYSTNWSQGGPIIEREGMIVQPFGNGQWLVAKADEDNFMRRHYSYRGATLLIAAMRCYVASKLGDKIDVPGELMR